MAQLTQKQTARYDVLAEALTADGRVVKRVEATADGLADVAEAFRLATTEARKAHVTPARVRLSAGRGGVTEVCVVDELAAPEGPMAQSALLDGKTKLDRVTAQRPPAEPVVPGGWLDQLMAHVSRLAPDLGPVHFEAYYSGSASPGVLLWRQRCVSYGLGSHLDQHMTPEERAQAIVDEVRKHLAHRPP